MINDNPTFTSVVNNTGSDARPANFLCHASYGKGSVPVPLWRQLGMEQV